MNLDMWIYVCRSFCGDKFLIWNMIKTSFQGFLIVNFLLLSKFLGHISQTFLRLFTHKFIFFLKKGFHSSEESTFKLSTFLLLPHFWFVGNNRNSMTKIIKHFHIRLNCQIKRKFIIKGIYDTWCGYSI